MAIKIPGKYLAATPLAQLFGSSPSGWTVSGWLFYNAHFVPIHLPTADTVNGLARFTNQSLLRLVGGPVLLVYLIPPLLLTCAGYLTVQYANTPGANGERNSGASIVAGYFPLFLVGSFLFRASAANAPVTAAPDVIYTIFLGLAYPILCGALGGLLSKRRATHKIDSSDGEVAHQTGKW